MCGEKEPQPDGEKQQAGSPPRVRGKASTHSTSASCTGITPACAGKSTESQCSQREPWDHPRVCGEKIFLVFLAMSAVGSPPRVRGKVASRMHPSGTPGITPACAGKSAISVTPFMESRDHPRVCGEKPLRQRAAGGEPGSPPRVRGKDPAHQRGRHRPGITPACAGKRKPTLPAERQTRDHPRVCGEK